MFISNKQAYFLGWTIAAALILILGLRVCDFGEGVDESDTTDPQPERIALWEQTPPLETDSGDINAYITIYQPSCSVGTAVVICPGGGYGAFNMEIEGHGIARWLNRHGIVGCVLEYRFPQGNPAIPLLDVQQAIRFVRQHAGEWAVQSNRVGIMGFSAGGHLASMAATLEEWP